MTRVAKQFSLALLGAVFLAPAAEAKPARCFTTDDGYYPCDFRATDRAGSFRIAAQGFPTYALDVDQPGFAFATATFGNKAVNLPGQFVRGSDDPACWSNPETSVKICAW